MAGADGWTDVGAAAELAATPLRRIAVGNSEIALSFRVGSFGAVANACNHAGGPLGEGCLDSDYIVCPWHHWKFHRVSGVGEPGFEEDRVPSFPVKVEAAACWSISAGAHRANEAPSAHPLARQPYARRARCGSPVSRPPPWTPPIRASRAPTTCSVTRSRPRRAGAETRLIRLNALKFRACEGYYSKSAEACTWPCSITQMDAATRWTRSTRRSCIGPTR